MRILQGTATPKEVITVDEEEWLAELESDLRKKKDRSDTLDELFQLTFLGDPEIRKKAAWCVAKMGQNKVPDTRIVDILIPLTKDPDPETRESVAWGIGEVAGAGIGDDRCISSLRILADDDNKDVRGMAAWATGRLRNKLSLTDPELDDVMKRLLNDESAYVAASARFALGLE